MRSSNLALADKSSPTARATHVRFASMTDTGMVRERNDDSHLILELPTTKGVVLMVADGMGGHADGDVASALAVSEVARSMERAVDTTADRVHRAVEAAHTVVCEAASGHSGRARMGTTLTVVHVTGTEAHISHVGDSRAYLVRAGQIEQLTRDQTVVEILIEGGMLEPADRELSPYAHQLSQVIGQSGRRLLVATSTVDLRDGDVFVVCSDGLTNVVSDEEIATAVRQGGPFDETCRALVELANFRGGPDNSTVVIADVHGPLPQATAEESIASTHRVVRSFRGWMTLRALADQQAV